MRNEILENDLKQNCQTEEMGHTWKNWSQLEKESHLEKWVTLGSNI